MNLTENRRAIRHLLDDSNPGDASAVYYAFHHPDDKTQIISYPPEASRASGYVCLSRTGMDLFRPFVTLRLPESGNTSGFDLTDATDMLFQSIPEGAAVIVNAARAYLPLFSALFDVEKEQSLKLFALDRGRFQPIINVFVTQTKSYDGLPRFVIRNPVGGRPSSSGEVVAAAGLNWQSEKFAEIYVHTKTSHRRQGYGQSVVAACVQYALDSGRKPLYLVTKENASSTQLAETVGFVSIGFEQVLLEGTRKSNL